MANEYDIWREKISRAADAGEINPDTDVEEAAALFRQVFVGLSYEKSFYDGLDTEQLRKRFQHIYSLLKR